MRTTLEIDDDVMQAAREVARLKNQGIGRAISDLARRGLAPEISPVVELQDGIPPNPWPVSKPARGICRFWPDEISLTDMRCSNFPF